MVKAMFKSIFFRLIFTPCCKYTYNKNNVKFSKPTSSELRQELLKLNNLKIVYKSHSLSAILFQPITARLFPIATPFPALFILTILFDEHQIKSFKHINILIKVQLFCWKKNFFLKLLFEKRPSFGRKKIFGKKIVFLQKKKVF